MPIKLIAAPHTPFDEDGRLKLSVVPAQARHLVDQQVSGAFVCGSTGEGVSLTVAERQQVAASWCHVGTELGLQVIVHIGGNSQPEAIQLAQHARQCGAAGVACLAPFYFRPNSVSQLVDFLKPLAAACDGLPFYFYDIPALTHVQVPTVEVLRLGQQEIPNLAGIKFTNPDLGQLQECLQFDQNQFEIWFGCDEALLAGYVLGVKGAVGSTYNFAAGLFHQLVAAFDCGDLQRARSYQFDALRLVGVLSRYGYLAAAKWLLAKQGVDCGPPRLPLQPLTAEEKQQLGRELDQLEFLDENWRVKIDPDENSITESKTGEQNDDG